MHHTTWSWTAVLHVVVFVGLGLALQARPANAQTALDTGVGGTATTVDDVISTTTPDELLNVFADLSAQHSHVCSVTGSADVNYGTDTDTGNVYIFGLRVDGAGGDLPDPASDRQLEFVGTADFDVFNKSVSTNMTFSVGPGDHTFRFSARQHAASDPDITVDASTLSVVCLKGSL